MISTGKKTTVLENNATNENDTYFALGNSENSAYGNRNIKKFTDMGAATEASVSNASVAEDIAAYTGVSADPSPITMQYGEEDENQTAKDEIYAKLNSFSASNADSRPIDQNEEEIMAAGEESGSFKLSARGKAMIAIYSIVVATIIALIMMNAKVLKNMQRDIEREESEIEDLIVRSQILEEELEYVSGEEAITERAIELGMTR